MFLPNKAVPICDIKKMRKKIFMIAKIKYKKLHKKHIEWRKSNDEEQLSKEVEYKMALNY